MPGVTTPRELLLHELRDVYYVENQLTKVLPQLAKEASDKELSRGFEQHFRETERHVKNLEGAFKELVERPGGEKCPGFDGLMEEHDEFMREEHVSTDVKDIFLTGAAARTEHYEIAAYTGLVSLARSLKERKVVSLLEKNLKDEKATLRKVDSIGRRIGRASATANGRPTRSRTTSRTRATKRAASPRSRSRAGAS